MKIRSKWVNTIANSGTVEEKAETRMRRTHIEHTEGSQPDRNHAQLNWYDSRKFWNFDVCFSSLSVLAEKEVSHSRSRKKSSKKYEV